MDMKHEIRPGQYYDDISSYGPDVENKRRIRVDFLKGDKAHCTVLFDVHGNKVDRATVVSLKTFKRSYRLSEGQDTFARFTFDVPNVDCVRDVISALRAEAETACERGDRDNLNAVADQLQAQLH